MICSPNLFEPKSGEERVYRVTNPDVRMGKMFRRHCSRCEMQVSSCRFMDEGEFVRPEQTYRELAEGLGADENGYVDVYLDCMVEQIGGRAVIWF